METTISLAARVPASLSEAPDASRSHEQVGAHAREARVKVPSWFTASAALRVAQLKGVDHLLVMDGGRVLGAVSREELEMAPPSDPLGRWAPTVPTTVGSRTTAGEALRLMDGLGLSALVVTAGPVLVGLVTRADLAAHGHRAA
jgi:CBS domain-containing protein